MSVIFYLVKNLNPRIIFKNIKYKYRLLQKDTVLHKINQQFFFISKLKSHRSTFKLDIKNSWKFPFLKIYNCYNLITDYTYTLPNFPDTIPSRPASRNWIKANSYTNLPSKFTKPSLRFLLVAHHENPSAKEEGRFHEVAKIETSLPFKRSLNYPNTVENDLATILYGRHPCTS